MYFQRTAKLTRIRTNCDHRLSLFKQAQGGLIFLNRFHQKMDSSDITITHLSRHASATRQNKNGSVTFTLGSAPHSANKHSACVYGMCTKCDTRVFKTTIEELLRKGKFDREDAKTGRNREIISITWCGLVWWKTYGNAKNKRFTSVVPEDSHSEDVIIPIQSKEMKMLGGCSKCNSFVRHNAAQANKMEKMFHPHIFYHENGTTSKNKRGGTKVTVRCVPVAQDDDGYITADASFHGRVIKNTFGKGKQSFVLEAKLFPRNDDASTVPINYVSDDEERNCVEVFPCKTRYPPP